MSRSKPLVRNAETPFHLHELFFSSTDQRGIIRSGNSVFIRVSGYTEAELINHPHNIVRHPDMPKAVFELFWEYLKAQRPICTYVKNLAKDGSYYWVCAAVFPVADGYFSIRLKPTSQIFEKIAGFYQRLLEVEGKGGINAARQELGEGLKQLGFTDYDHFMTKALTEEIRSRKKGLGQGYNQTSDQTFRSSLTTSGVFANLVEQSSTLFDQVVAVIEHSEAMNESSERVLKLFSGLKFLGINMIISATSLGEASQTLVVVAEGFCGLAHDIESSMESLREALLSLQGSIRSAEYKVAASQLQMEMLNVLSGELDPRSTDSEKEEFNFKCKSLLELITTYAVEVRQSLDILVETLTNFEKQSETLNTAISGLEVIRVRGSMEGARLSEGKQFMNHVHAMHEFVVTVRNATAFLVEKSNICRNASSKGRDLVEGIVRQVASLQNTFVVTKENNLDTENLVSEDSSLRKVA